MKLKSVTLENTRHRVGWLKVSDSTIGPDECKDITLRDGVVFCASEDGTVGIPLEHVLFFVPAESASTPVQKYKKGKR